MLTMLKRESNTHLGPLPGRRKETYVMGEACVVLRVLSVPVHEPRASSALDPSWGRTEGLGARCTFHNL